MKPFSLIKRLGFLALLGCYHTGFAQSDTLVEIYEVKNSFTRYEIERNTVLSPKLQPCIFGAQVGLIGFWIYNEYKLLEKLALRSEIGYALKFGLGDLKINDPFPYPFTPFVAFGPEIALELRHYYHLSEIREFYKKTSSFRDLHTVNRYQNYVGIKTNHEGGWLSADNSGINTFSAFLEWGGKGILNGFTYEYGLGLGYEHVLDTDIADRNRFAMDFHLRFGFTFPFD